MFKRVLAFIKERMRNGCYVMTLHAEEEMDNDDLEIFDVENAVWTGKIIERQRDRETGEWKYLMKGQALSKTSVIVVLKLSPTGKVVILTVYKE
jgi:hypothetical protein